MIWLLVWYVSGILGTAMLWPPIHEPDRVGRVLLIGLSVASGPIALVMGLWLVWRRNNL